MVSVKYSVFETLDPLGIGYTLALKCCPSVRFCQWGSFLLVSIFNKDPYYLRSILGRLSLETLTGVL